ncbi:MAG: DUF3999 domain-containing protein [Campylobacteraceae bacterium]|jgi:hypothetical protein|nr:DUF3999 domain-containing protein [Campylobacteraceae bacterium]
MYKKILSVLVLAATLAAAQNLNTTQSYAYGFEIAVEGEGAFSVLNIPDEVYAQTLSPSLDDVNILNKNNQSVAFAFRSTDVMEDITQEENMTIFFLDGRPSNTTNGDTIYTYEYLVSLPDNITIYPSSFKFDWDSVPYNWVADVDINVQRGGYNTSLAKNAYLSELKDVSDKSTSKSDTIALNSDIYDNSKGWRITISSNKEIPNITSVKAYAKERLTSASFVAFNTTYENSNEGLIYSLPSPQPLDDLFIDLKRENLMLPLGVFYKDGDEWIRLERRVVKKEAHIRPSGAIVAKEFLLTTNGGFGEDIPQVTIYRKRADIIFNSANNAPFILAYGSFDAKSPALPLYDFLQDTNNNITIASIGKQVKLDGESALKPVVVAEKASMPKWVIWIFLALGVAFLVFLAYKLSKEIKAE